jgi:pyridinium-3,5-biscarboxylic acid mononucleotide synthase
MASHCTESVFYEVKAGLLARHRKVLMSSESEILTNILSRFLQNDHDRHAAVTEILASRDTAEIPGAAVDLNRATRCGFPEVVFGEGKSAELITDIFCQQHESGQRAFATRVSAEQAATIRNVFPEAEYNATARTLLLWETGEAKCAVQSSVAVVTAGSCDAAVAAEAAATLRWMGVGCELIEDVGVAGPQRLLKHVPLLQSMHAIVCVAGMEAALPSVVGGHVACPVIGVPTSVGYGASFGGITAMLSMLTCCASNVVTVNIDAGFRGGYVAGLIARGADRDDNYRNS